MKIETKQTLVLMFAFLGCVTGIAGAYGIVISGIENNYDKMILSIPFWIICVIGYVGAYLIGRTIKKPLTKVIPK